MWRGSRQWSRRRRPQQNESDDGHYGGACTASRPRLSVDACKAVRMAALYPFQAHSDHAAALKPVVACTAKSMQVQGPDAREALARTHARPRPPCDYSVIYRYAWQFAHVPPFVTVAPLQQIRCAGGVIGYVMSPMYAMSVRRLITADLPLWSSPPMATPASRTQARVRGNVCCKKSGVAGTWSSGATLCTVPPAASGAPVAVRCRGDCLDEHLQRLTARARGCWHFRAAMPGARSVASGTMRASGTGGAARMLELPSRWSSTRHRQHPTCVRVRQRAALSLQRR